MWTRVGDGLLAVLVVVVFVTCIGAQFVPRASILAQLGVGLGLTVAALVSLWLILSTVHFIYRAFTR